jgi:hypothetical protein
MEQSSGLLKDKNLKPASVVYNEYFQRSLVPEQVQQFTLSLDKVQQIVKGE